MPKNIVRDWQVFVEGFGYAGSATGYEPPKWTILNTPTRTSGTDTAVPMDMGLEFENLTITFAGYEPGLGRLVGRLDDVLVTMRGALTSAADQVNAKQIVQVTGGKVLGYSLDGFSVGESPPSSFVLAPSYYREEYDGQVITEIDALNYVRVVDGVDQLAAIRDAIGR